MTTVTISANATFNDSDGFNINEDSIKVLTSEKFKKEIDVKYKGGKMNFNYMIFYWQVIRSFLNKSFKNIFSTTN